MKFALNVRKGTTVNHPKLGQLVGGVAVAIDDEDVDMAKHLINVVVFDRVDYREDNSNG